MFPDASYGKDSSSWGPLMSWSELSTMFSYHVKAVSVVSRTWWYNLVPLSVPLGAFVCSSWSDCPRFLTVTGLSRQPALDSIAQVYVVVPVWWILPSFCCHWFYCGVVLAPGGKWSASSCTVDIPWYLQWRLCLFCPLVSTPWIWLMLLSVLLISKEFVLSVWIPSVTWEI